MEDVIAGAFCYRFDTHKTVQSDGRRVSLRSLGGITAIYMPELKMKKINMLYFSRLKSETYCPFPPDKLTEI